MERQLYKEMYDIEKNHWWFLGRRKILFDVMRRTINGKTERVLDVGCGTGLNALFLERIGGRVYGLEASDEAIAMAKERNPRLMIIKGEFPHVEIKDRFDLITLFDVLEHCENDLAALRKIHSLLNHDGYAVFTVPAFSFLWSEHDELAHHKRRYTASELRQKLEHAGFEVIRTSYFNAFLFLPAAIFRVLRKLLGLWKGSSDFFMLPAPLNSVLAFMFGSERFFLRFVDFPFGVSIIAIAQKR